MHLTRPAYVVDIGQMASVRRMETKRLQSKAGIFGV
jgi:hypothetical protein